MRLLTIFFYFILVLNNELFSQEPENSTKPNNLFVPLTISDSIPKLRMLSGLDFKLTKSTTIQVGGLGSLTFVWDSSDLPNFILVINRTDNTILTMRGAFKPGDGQYLMASFLLSFNSNSNVQYPLDIKLNEKKDNISYRWTNGTVKISPTESIPVKVHKLIDLDNNFPAIILESINHDKGLLQQEGDTVIVINWWAVWCQPCVEEIPGLNILVEKYSDKRVKFYSIATNTSEEVKSFLSKHQFKYSHFLANETLVEIFGNAYPRNIIINRNNIIVYDRSGANSETYIELDKVLEQIVK